MAVVALLKKAFDKAAKLPKEKQESYAREFIERMDAAEKSERYLRSRGYEKHVWGEHPEIDEKLTRGLKDIEEGRVSPAFESADELIAALHEHYAG